VIFVPDDPARKALLEEVTFAGPAAIESLRIEGVQTVHPSRHLPARRLDQDVEVRPKQAPGVEPPAEHLDDVSEQQLEPLPVGVVEEDVDAAGAPSREVEDAVLG
jgi:hypothetical protein